MTVIAYKDGVMAADSASFTAGMRYRSMRPKIGNCALGLVGAAGPSSDAMLFRQWMTDGMPKEKPEFTSDKDDPMYGLWAKTDGTLWWCDNHLVFVQIESPYAIGEATACTFSEGAMLAGLSAEEAVRLAIKHCLYGGGKVQVERLLPALAEAAE